MSPTHTVPHACHLRNPACPGTLNTHHLILDDSRFASLLLMVVETDSPLFLVYQVALQCNGRILHLFILSYRAHLSYLITALVLSFSFIYGCGLVSS